MKSLSVLLAALLTLTVAACNTIEGVGKDVEKVGEEVQDIADGN